MKTLSAFLLAALFICIFSGLTSATTIVDIFAYENSLMRNPLNTGILLNSGDVLSVTVDPLDMWRAGGGDRESNADGLGNPYGGNFGYYSYGGYSFLYGSLVGRIGSGGYFFVGTSFNQTVNQTGNLTLLYWDSNYSDNSGYVTAEIDVQPVPEPSSAALLMLGIACVVFLRKKLV